VYKNALFNIIFNKVDFQINTRIFMTLAFCTKKNCVGYLILVDWLVNNAVFIQVSIIQ